MALPKIETPIYELTLPSNGKKVKFRPFLSKEEKLLMMAKEDDNTKTIISTIQQLIDVCSFGSIDAKTMTSVDVEWFFLQLRAKSVGETIELSRPCRKIQEDGKPCIGSINIDIPIQDIEPPKIEKDSNIIKIDEKISVVMKWPDISYMDRMGENSDDDEIIKGLIHLITSGSQVFNPKDESPEEIQEFVDSLNIVQKNKIRKFITDQPTIKTKVDYKCSECGNSGSVEFKGLKDFFG